MLAVPQTLIPICHCSLENVLPQSVSLWTLETTKKCKKNPNKPPIIAKASSPFSDTSAHLCGLPCCCHSDLTEGPVEVRSLFCCQGCGVLVCSLSARQTCSGRTPGAPASFSAFLLPAPPQLPPLPLLAQNSCWHSWVDAELK